MKAKAQKKELLSPRRFGLALGVTRQAVQEALRTGRITAKSATKDDRGHWSINLEVGRAEWEAWTDPSMRRETKPRGRESAAVHVTPSLFEAEDRERKTQQVSHARASAERVAIDAELKRWELEQLRGNLVDRREAQREAFRIGRLVRDRLQAIPDRIAASLAALDKPAAVHERLAAEIAQALEALVSEQKVAPA